MRIIAGEARGRTLYAPRGTDTRPTADKVREALFSILRDFVPGARVLDLFAGSGAMALEAVSRGAESAVLVDCSREARAAIERNIAAVGCQQSALFILADYRAALKRLSGPPFSLVFFDPPYRMTEAYAFAAREMAAKGLLEDGARVVMEHSVDFSPDPGEGFALADERAYGSVRVTIFKYASGVREEQSTI